MTEIQITAANADELMEQREQSQACLGYAEIPRAFEQSGIKCLKLVTQFCRLRKEQLVDILCHTQHFLKETPVVGYAA